MQYRTWSFTIPSGDLNPAPSKGLFTIPWQPWDTKFATEERECLDVFVLSGMWIVVSELWSLAMVPRQSGVWILQTGVNPSETRINKSAKVTGGMTESNPFWSSVVSMLHNHQKLMTTDRYLLNSAWLPTVKETFQKYRSQHVAFSSRYTHYLSIPVPSRSWNPRDNDALWPLTRGAKPRLEGRRSSCGASTHETHTPENRAAIYDPKIRNQRPRRRLDWQNQYSSQAKTAKSLKPAGLA